MITARRAGRIVLAILALVAAACGGGSHYGDFEVADLVVSETPLGGEALTQRKHEMKRAYGDLVHFHATLESLVDRRDARSIGIFDEFLARYLGTHIVPLLRAEWTSTHPELASLDASLRFAEAEVLIQMRYPRRVQMVIDELERRFEGRADLLVRYPLAGQGTLGAGLERLRDRKWSG